MLKGYRRKDDYQFVSFISLFFYPIFAILSFFILSNDDFFFALKKTEKRALYDR